MVVIPAILSGPDEVDSLLEQLEQHYLRNPDNRLYFALLTDFTDASEQHQPGDEELILRTRQGIKKVERKIFTKRAHRSYSKRQWPRFLLPFTSPAVMESFRRCLDGLGT